MEKKKSNKKRGLTPEALAGEGVKPEKGSIDNKLKKSIRILHEYKRNIVSVASKIYSGKKLKEVEKRTKHISECFNWFQFKHYPEWDGLKAENRVTRAFSCNQYKLCPICAMRRSRKVFGELSEKIKELALTAEDLYLVTITVKNDDSLEEALEELRGFYSHLTMGRRNSKRRSWTPENTPWGLIDGWIGHCEITRNKKSEWHPHYHFLITPLPQYKHLFKLEKVEHSFGEEGGYFGSLFASYLGTKLHKYTKGKSYIVHCQSVSQNEKLEEGETSEGGAIAEVTKYLFKFSSMEPEDVWEAYDKTKGMRLACSGGCFRGVKTDPKELLDEPIEGVDRPWIEWYSIVKNHGAEHYTWHTKIVDSYRCSFESIQNVVVGKRLEAKTVYSCT